jgi:hypothetical protein
VDFSNKTYGGHMSRSLQGGFAGYEQENPESSFGIVKEKL